MSGFQGHGRDFSEFNHMSTDDLEAILQADFELPDDEESDIEKILYITEVIAQRRAGQPSGRYANEDEAWDSFVENYCSESDREVFRKIKAVERKTPGDWKRILIRAASIAAAFVMVAAASTVTASAFGFNAFKTRKFSIQMLAWKSLSSWWNFGILWMSMDFRTGCFRPICQRDMKWQS